MLDLKSGARDDEQFHLQDGQPTAKIMSRGFFHTHITWNDLFLPDGTTGEFCSHWILGGLFHWYHGTCKCDGSRTKAYWAGQLDNGQKPKYKPDAYKYVMTTTPKEMHAFRVFQKVKDPNWDNMGA